MGVTYFSANTPESGDIDSPMIISLYGNQKTYNIKDFVPLEIDGYKYNGYKVAYIGFENNIPVLFLTSYYIIYYVEGRSDRKILENIYKITPSKDEFSKVLTRTVETKYNGERDIVEYKPNVDFFKDYCKYFTIKDGKIISKYRCDKYINPIESFGYIN